jgi:hypothetical protein
VSTLKQEEFPDIWVAAGDGCSYLEKFSYVLSELPSKGALFCDQDRNDIKVIKFKTIFTNVLERLDR